MVQTIDGLAREVFAKIQEMEKDLGRALTYDEWIPLWRQFRADCAKLNAEKNPR